MSDKHYQIITEMLGELNQDRAEAIVISDAVKEIGSQLAMIAERNDLCGLLSPKMQRVLDAFASDRKTLATEFAAITRRLTSRTEALTAARSGMSVNLAVSSIEDVIR